ncbi:MAG: hypothetical protein JW973_11420 [Bacteroidales bacterium]|nr:hypothetical protein [Bacteroidales bacterium]
MTRCDLLNPVQTVQSCFIHFTVKTVFIVIMSFFCSGIILCQTKIEISPPDLRFVNDRLIIRYNITGYKPDDQFRVELEITDSTDTRIKANSLYGDIGDNVSGGDTKQIIWDLAADSIFMNIDISVEVFVTRKAPPAPVVAERNAEALPEIRQDSLSAGKTTETPSEIKTEPDVTLKTKKTEGRKEKGTSGTSTKLGSNLLLSTLVPGWGLTRLSDGKPYWLIGVVGYGCIVSSVYLNMQASSNYDKYANSTEAEKIDSYFDTGKKQYTASNVLGWSALAIWVADLGITWVITSKMKNSAIKSKLSSFSVRTSYNGSANTPMVSFFYTF